MNGDAGSDRDRLLIELQRAEALCYSDDADLAPEAVAAVERMAPEFRSWRAHARDFGV